MTLLLHCLLSDSWLAQEYSNQLLCHDDLLRIQKNPLLANRLDWKVSRSLKRYATNTVIALSHSKGFSAVLSTAQAQHIKAGVDIEYMRIRDFQSLAAWICSPQEQQYLHQNHWHIEAFYRLWCIKESLLKAANLNFPADMPNVGYLFHNKKIIALRVKQQTNWCGRSSILAQNFIFACVWQKCDVQVNWQFYGRLNACSLSQHIHY